MVRWWQVVTVMGAAWEQVPVLYGKNRPDLACHNFLTQIISCHVCEKEDIDILQELPAKITVPCTLQMQYTSICQDFTMSKSTRQRFRTYKVSYLEHYLTTQPHETRTTCVFQWHINSLSYRSRRSLKKLAHICVIGGYTVKRRMGLDDQWHLVKGNCMWVTWGPWRANGVPKLGGAEGQMGRQKANGDC